MSRRHAWLTFTAGGPPLAHTLMTDAVAWQRALRSLQSRWYATDAPPQVAAAFVLQWLLQVPAHTGAHAAASGPWRADLTHLSFALDPATVPREVRLNGLVADEGSLEQRFNRAERGQRGEHDGQVGLDRVAGVVEDRAGSQVALAHPERRSTCHSSW
jgi:hypothetical protein